MRENLISFENRIKNLEFLSYKIAESSGINLKNFKKTIIRIAVGIKIQK